MEDNKIDNLLLSLEDEIERKCFKIREKKKEKMKKRLFLLACVFSFSFPLLFHYLGLNLVAVCSPVIGFLAVAMITLLPAMILNIEVE